MNEVSLYELNEYFNDTLEKCNLGIFSQNEDTIECNVLEDFYSGVHSFLHVNSLSKLFKNGFINEEIFLLSQELREKALMIPENRWDIGHIRNSDEWREVIQLSDKILKLKIVFDSKKTL